MPAFPIYVYGNGSLFKEYLDAIAGFMGTNTFSSLLDISILLATTTVCYSYITKRSLMVIIKWLGLFYLSIYVLFIPRATVVIIDSINNDLKYHVDNVPFGLAVLASYTSTIDDALTKAIEANFTMPDYMPYHKTGMVFASRLVSMSSQFEITDTSFDANLQDFVHQCVFYDILLNKYSINDLLNASNVWKFVSEHASPARAFLYDGSITTCKDGTTKLTKDWEKGLNSSIEQYSLRIYPSLKKEEVKAQFLLDLPISYRYLTTISAKAEDIMQQNLMANAIQRGVVGMGAKLNASAALESYAYVRAQEQKRLTNKTVGEMAADWLPLMKIAFEAIIYGSFIFIVLLSVFPFGGMVIRNYVLSLLWIHTWAPMYAIINLMVSYHAQSNSLAATQGVMSLKAMSGLLQINSDIAGLAGYLSMLVPFFASGIVFGMHKVLTQGAQYDGGLIQSSASSSVNEAVSGNINLGNTSLGTHQAFNNNANHVDINGRAFSGMTTTQLAGGSQLSVSADGSHIMDMRSAISNLGTAINYSDTLRNSYTQQAEKAETAMMSEGNTYSQSSHAGIREMYDLSSHLNKSKASGHSWSMSTNAAAVHAIGENSRLTKDFAERHHLSYHDAANVLASAYTDAKLSGSIGMGTPMSFGVGANVGLSGSGGYSRSAGHTSGTDKGSAYSNAQNYIQDTNYAKNIDFVSRAVKDHSLRFNDEEGNRFLNNMSASFDKAETARHDVQNHYQEAQTAREAAAYVSEHAGSIQINATQQYAEWLSSQPGTNGQGRMGYGSIEAIHKDPHLSEYYANQFLEQYKSQFESNWHHGLPSTKEGIHQKYQSDNYQKENLATVETSYNRNKQTILAHAKQQGLHSNIVDTTAQQQSENVLTEHKKDIDQKGNDISQRGDNKINQINKEELRKRHGGLTHDLIKDIDTKNY